MHNESNFTSSEKNNTNFFKIINYAVNKVMTSRFCDKNCLNFSNIFDKENKENIPLIKENKKQEYSSRIFIDEVHLTDTGNKILADEITKNMFN